MMEMVMTSGAVRRVELFKIIFISHLQSSSIVHPSMGRVSCTGGHPVRASGL